MEIWKIIKGTKRVFSVSNCGRVRNNKRNLIKKLGIDHRGYQCVGVPINGRKAIHRVHRLVLIAFKPIKNANDFTVHHKDYNRVNNNLDNLEWLSAIDNQNKKIQNCDSYQIFKQLLTKHGDTKLNNILTNLNETI